MSPDQLTYLVFGCVLITAVVVDLGVLSKRSVGVSIQKALGQTAFWVALAFAFFGFLTWKEGHVTALEYLSAYLMEWSLSIDNIFVFILIFTYFKIHSEYVARALLIGILMAIVLRVIFITVGVVLVEKFDWILYGFGAFLVYTGIKIFTVGEKESFNPETAPVYRLLNKVFPIYHEDESGKIAIRRDGKRRFTNMFVVIVLLATTDIVFALDSIPAVFAISQDRLVIYTSNIFAVLGLRSLFFLLRGAVARFEYLQQGIAIVLIFIGAKMLAEHWLEEIFDKNELVIISLGVIVLCLGGAILYSLFRSRKAATKNGLT